MKSKYNDERLDKMLGNLLGSEVPEDLQFHNELSGEIIVAVKNKEHHCMCFAGCSILYRTAGLRSVQQ